MGPHCLSCHIGVLRLCCVPRQLTSLTSPQYLVRQLATRACAANIPQQQAPTSAEPHIPVLLTAVLDHFRPLQLEVYVDGTLGAGGHATALLQQHPEMHTLVGLDVDPVAHTIAAAKLQRVQPPHTQLRLLQGNFCQVKALLQQLPGQLHEGRVNGILLDLGTSSMQIDTAERGFSFLREGPLDMRMGPSARLSAEELLNTWPEAELGRIFREYGEERFWKGITRRIVEARQTEPLHSTQQIVSLVGGPSYRQSSGSRKPGSRQIHPATRVFQALRIAVNEELTVLETALPDMLSCLAPGGRLGVISFHSLEDRIVKWQFLRAAGRGSEPYSAAGMQAQLMEEPRKAEAKILTKRPIVADEEERQANPRSRSAKLRFVEKL
ncbi:hypothetical protein WJX72_011869 [[Myrmecia] bisecta]|uniref:Uncharacterized protein n=1 Tax=[Myrmecia] bisecta TaxID=41462 RepID=A0AAW1Q213_9CHLO